MEDGILMGFNHLQASKMSFIGSRKSISKPGDKGEHGRFEQMDEVQCDLNEEQE